jgi:hypothetical protein
LAWQADRDAYGWSSICLEDEILTVAVGRTGMMQRSIYEPSNGAGRERSLRTHAVYSLLGGLLGMDRGTGAGEAQASSGIRVRPEATSWVRYPRSGRYQCQASSTPSTARRPATALRVAAGVSASARSPDGFQVRKPGTGWKSRFSH